MPIKSINQSYNTFFLYSLSLSPPLSLTLYVCVCVYSHTYGYAHATHVFIYSFDILIRTRKQYLSLLFFSFSVGHSPKHSLTGRKKKRVVGKESSTQTGTLTGRSFFFHVCSLYSAERNAAWSFRAPCYRCCCCCSCASLSLECA